RRAETEPAVRKRFKALAVVNNLDAIKMQRLVGPFNGKPVLITESGSLFLEMDVNVRQWSFLARKGLHKLEPKFGLMNISVGFLIEGRQDDEV
ncbi:unnamed protein product, partial [Sphacelaria rigidula]